MPTRARRLGKNRQDAREREIAAGHAEAEAATRALQTRLTELETLLASTLDEDPYVPFDQLKETMLLADFRPPTQLAEAAAEPQERDFMPEPLSGLGALAPGRKRAYAAAVAHGRADYERAITAHVRAEQARCHQLAHARAAYETAIIRERERIQRQHDAIDQMANDFAARRRKAVADYFCQLLAMQRYPGDFPTGVKVAYLPAEQEIIADIDLPLLEAVPELASCEYLPTKKALRHKRLTVSARNALYQLVIAQMALRALRCVFTADRGGLVRTVARNGYVDTINTATGKPARWCLISTKVDRDQFDDLDLAYVK